MNTYVLGAGYACMFIGGLLVSATAEPTDSDRTHLIKSVWSAGLTIGAFMLMTISLAVSLAK